MAGRVTLADVAAAAGVSVSTASKALGNAGQLSQATRTKVLGAARALGYRRRTGETRRDGEKAFTIGIISSDQQGRFTLPILAGAEAGFDRVPVSIIMCEARGDGIRERHYLRVLLDCGVDGIIVTGESSAPRRSIGRMPVPVVYALAPSLSASDVSVVPDDRAGAARAVEHLVNRGRRTVGIVAGSRRYEPNRHRVDGAVDMLAANGLVPVGDGALHGEFTEQWGRDAATQLLNLDPALDAVFCTNDQIARGVAERFERQGLEVPRRVAVVGVDNWEVMTLAARPQLTSVDLNLPEVGRVAAKALLDAVEGLPVHPGVERVDCALVVRESS